MWHHNTLRLATYCLKPVLGRIWYNYQKALKREPLSKPYCIVKPVLSETRLHRIHQHLEIQIRSPRSLLSFNDAAGGWARWALAHPEFGSSVHPILTWGGQIIPTHYWLPTRIWKPSGISVIDLTYRELHFYVPRHAFLSLITKSPYNCFSWYYLFFRPSNL